jgi:hypothetical protein
VLEKTEFSDYADYINISIFLANLDLQAIVDVIKTDEQVLADFIEEITPSALIELIGYDKCKEIFRNDSDNILPIIPIDKITDAFGLPNIINALGGYGKIISDGLISEAELISAAGGYSALIKFFDADDIIGAVGISKILDYVGINDVADSVGGFPAFSRCIPRQNLWKSCRRSASEKSGISRLKTTCKALLITNSSRST